MKIKRKLKHKKILSFTLKTLIVIISYFYIYKKISQYNFDELLYYQNFTNYNKLTLLIFTIILMPLNWFVEAVKWKDLIKKIQEISKLKSIEAVLIGSTFAIFTPNRIGELGGRVIVLEKENRYSGVFSTAVGSISQMLTTIINGIIAICFFVIFYNDNNKLESLNNIYIFIIIGFLSGCLLLYLYFNFNKIIPIIKKIVLLKKLYKHYSFLGKYSKTELLKVLLYSNIRYIIFTFQFFLLLHFFNVNINIFQSYIATAITYFTIMFIPSVTISEIGVRASLSVFFIGYFSANEIGIVYASALLWIINVAIISITGSFLLYKANHK